MPSKDDKVKNQVIKNAFFQGISGIIAKIGGMVFTIIAARFLFPELFGIYSLALIIILTIVTTSDLGIGTTIARYVAESLNKKNKAKAKKEARSRFLFLIKFKFLVSLILALLLFFLSSTLSVIFKKPDLVLPLQIGAVYLFIAAIYGIFGSLFLAIQKIKYSTISEIIFEISRVGLLFVFLYLYKSVWSVFLVLSISVLLATIYCFFIVLKRYPFLFKGKTDSVERKRLLFFSGFLAINSINAMIFANIDRLMLGYYIDAKFIGFYTAIFTLISGMLAIVSLGGVVLPVFVGLEKEKLKSAFQKVFHYMLIIALPSTIGLAFVLIPLMKILYGAAYVPIENEFSLTITSALLSLLVVEGTITGLYSSLFNAKEKPKWPALILFLAAISNILLNFIFISILIKIKPEYGLIGAALATFLTRYATLFVLSIFAKKKFGVQPKLISIFKTLVATLAMLGFMVLFAYIFGKSILAFIIMILCSIVFYFFLIFLLKEIKKEDIRMIKQSIFSKKKK